MHKKKLYYRRRRHHPGLSTFIRVFVGLLLGLNVIVAAVEKEGSYDSILNDSKEVARSTVSEVIDMSGINKSMKKISRSLRGKDPTAILTAADEGVDSHIEILQSLIELQKEGNTKDKASTIRSLIRGFKDFNKNMNEGNELMMNPELSKMMEAIPDLPLDDSFEMDMVTDEQLVEMFTHILLVQVQDLDQIKEHAEGMKDLSRTVTDILSAAPLSAGHRRHLKEDLFEFDEGSSPFEFGGGKFKQSSGQGHFKPSFNFGSNKKYRDVMKNARDKARRQVHSRYKHGDTNRRLQDDNNRINSIPQCRPTCDITNNTCNCENLFGCVKNMSSYDVTVLMTNDYIDDDGNFTSADFVDVFDATDGAILSKLARAQNNAQAADSTNEDQCMNVLEEFHSSCNINAEGEICPGGSVDYESSFQLTVDQVCNSVHTDTKLMFEPIHRVFDYFPNSCGILQSQTVYVGCNTTYLTFEARQAQCYVDTGCSAVDCVGYSECDDCCTSKNKCYAGQGNCDSDNDCQDGFKCGTGNCESQFAWLNGNSHDNCCVPDTAGSYSDGSPIYLDESKLNFDGWNAEETSCGISNGQTVYTGCGYTYLVKEQRDRQCGSGGTSTINIDGWVDPALQTDDENCGSVSYSACAKFIETFDRLYKARPLIQYPDGNPMLNDSSDTITTSSNLEFYKIMFPIAYSFDQSIHGVIDPKTLKITPADIAGFPGEKLVNIKGENLALNKPTKQKSTIYGNDSEYGPQNAVDGNINTFSNTDHDPGDGGGVTQWWQVDLEHPFEITSIVIVQRQDCADCQARLSEFYIRLIADDGSTIVGEQYITTQVTSGPTGTTYTGWPATNRARYVRVYMPYRGEIAMAEVQVYGNYLGTQGPGDYCLTSQFNLTQVAKEAMSTCDTSMALLLGADMSLGTFIEIVNEVEDKSPNYMPGTCCQDTAITSEYFGVEYDPSKGMVCKYPGLWHLGLSSEACENGGGVWFRSPCLELQECINNRPQNCTDGTGPYFNSTPPCVPNPVFSQSFENFAVGLVINDPSDQEQCGNTRQGLGFDPDYEFDTDVCDTFDQFMCDPTYDGIDEITVNDTEPVSTPIEYEPIPYTTPSPLPFTPLDKKTAPDLVSKSQQDGIWGSTVALQEAMNEAANGYEAIKEFVADAFSSSDFICNQIDAGLAGLTLALQSICYALAYVLMLVYLAGETAAFAILVATNTAYNAVVVANENYAQDIYYNMFDDDGWVKWVYKSLNTINTNIYNENTEMLDDINDNTVDTANCLGCQIIVAFGGTCTSVPPNCPIDNPTRRRLNSLGSKGEVKIDASWDWNGESIGFMEMVSRSVESMIGDVCESNPRAKGSKKKPKADKSESNIFTYGEEEGKERRDLIEVGYEALEVQLDDMYDRFADIKGKVEDVSDMKGRMEKMESKMNMMEDKMDTIIEMMTQLLQQEKMGKE